MLVSIQSNRIDKTIQIVRIESNILAISCDHVCCAHSVEVVDVDLADRTFNTYSTALTRLTIALIRAG